MLCVCQTINVGYFVYTPTTKSIVYISITLESANRNAAQLNVIAFKCDILCVFLLELHVRFYCQANVVSLYIRYHLYSKHMLSIEFQVQ